MGGLMWGGLMWLQPLSVNGRHFFVILLYSILICIVLDAPWSYLVSCFRSFKFEEEEQEVPSTTVANIHYKPSSQFRALMTAGPGLVLGRHATLVNYLRTSQMS